MQKLKKSAGQLAYEADVKAQPLYHDGTKRKEWGQLGQVEQWSWQKYPTGINNRLNPDQR
jgi:hypothetical protein